MKRLLFLGLVTLLLSSCGGKEKITNENGAEILNELIGYPQYGVKSIEWRRWVTKKGNTFFGLNRISQRLLEGGFIEELPILGHPRKEDEVTLEPNVIFQQYVYQSQEPYCETDGGYTRDFCISCVGYVKEYIETIHSVSEEVEGKVTIEYDLVTEYNDMGRIIENYQLDGSPSKRKTITILRTEDGWMLEEPIVFKAPTGNCGYGTFGYVSDVSEFGKGFKETFDSETYFDETEMEPPVLPGSLRLN